MLLVSCVAATVLLVVLSRASMSDTTDNQPIQLAIGEILREADPVSKVVIGAYSHLAPHATNVKALSSSKFKTEQLEACAKYLGLKTRDDANALIFTNKPTLADRIITMIETTFPSSCQECGDGYRVKITDQQSEHRLRCFLCLQPSHDCDKIKSTVESLAALSTTLIGNAWICSGCYEKNNPLLSNNPRKRSGSVSFEISTPNSSPAIPRAGQNSAINRILTDNINDSSSVLSNNSMETVRPAPESDDHPQDICKRYTDNKCPHGINGNKIVNGVKCPDYHPRRCYKYCKFGPKRKGGCNKGDRCNNYHPKLCRNSLSSLSCFNENCTYVHLKSTMRRRDSTQPDTNQSRRRAIPPSHSHENPRGGERPHPPRSRFDSMASNSNRPVTPGAVNYSDSSSDVSFLFRMLQSMKSDFQKDMAQLRDCISLQARLNAPPTRPPPNLSQALPAQMNPQEIYQHPPTFQPNPLWAQNVPLYSS